jgi:hypothetical protein
MRWADIFLASEYARLPSQGITIERTGKVGIGTATPAVALDVVGNVRCSSGYDLNYTTVPTYTSNQIGHILDAIYTSSFNGSTDWIGQNYASYTKVLYINNIPEGIWLFTVSFQYQIAGNVTTTNYFQTLSNFWTSTTGGTGTRTEFPSGFSFCHYHNSNANVVYTGQAYSFIYRATSATKSWTCWTNAPNAAAGVSGIYGTPYARAVRIA